MPLLLKCPYNIFLSWKQLDNRKQKAQEKKLESGGIGIEIHITGRHRVLSGAIQGTGRHTLLRSKPLGLPGEEWESRAGISG